MKAHETDAENQKVLKLKIRMEKILECIENGTLKLSEYQNPSKRDKGSANAESIRSLKSNQGS